MTAFRSLFIRIFLVAAWMTLPHLAAGRKRITIPITPHSTVADVVRSTHNGHAGFNIPLVPQFTNRFMFQAAPWSLHQYPAMHTEHLTTAAMVRFIQRSPELFEDSPKLSAYKKALSKAVEAHATWFSKQTPENAQKLHAAENEVMAFLQGIRLSKAKVRSTLENILSTPRGFFPLRLIDKFFLPFRSSIATHKKDGVEIKKVHLSGTVMTGIKSTLFNILAAAYLTRAEFPFPRTVKRLVTQSAGWLHRTIKPHFEPLENLVEIPVNTEIAAKDALRQVNQAIKARNAERQKFRDKFKLSTYTSPSWWDHPLTLMDRVRTLSSSTPQTTPGGLVVETTRPTQAEFKAFGKRQARAAASRELDTRGGRATPSTVSTPIDDEDLDNEQTAHDLATLTQKRSDFLIIFTTLSAMSFYAWISDHKLVPEPDGGIIVSLVFT